MYKNTQTKRSEKAKPQQGRAVRPDSRIKKDPENSSKKTPADTAHGSKKTPADQAAYSSKKKPVDQTKRRREHFKVHQEDERAAGKVSGKEIWQAGNMLYPLPAVMVSCAREGEKPNIITVAWAGTVCTNPPMVSISLRPGRYSHRIIEESGEFVINLVTRELVRACDWCGVRSGREHDKFARCNLDPEPARELKWAPLIAQSPVNIECRVKQKISLGSHDMFLADVVCVHADKAGMEESGRYDLGKAKLITYSHGEYYALGEKLGTFGYSVKKPGKGR